MNTQVQVIKVKGEIEAAWLLEKLEEPAKINPYLQDALYKYNEVINNIENSTKQLGIKKEKQI